MTLKKFFISLFVLATSLFSLHFWQSSNADTVVKPSAQVEPVAFHPKKIVKQMPLNDESPKPEIALISHPSTSSELEGKLNSEYQIREDILAYIDEATKNNEKARRAAIKFTYYENQSYYHSLTSDEAVAWDRKHALAGWCLVEAEPENWLSIRHKITAFMNDSAKRKQHIQEIDHKFFAWKVLGTGLTQGEENERCKSGNY